MIDSQDINKKIREIISPVVRANGFSKVRTRSNWGYHGDCIWVFNLRGLGNYLGTFMDFPTMSLTAWLGVYYEFIPGREEHIRKDKDGRLLPLEHVCQMRMGLKTKNVDLQKRPKLPNPREQDRKDVWWVDPEGNNIETMLWDIRESFLETGVPWLEEMTDLDNVLEQVRTECDCRNKYWRATYLAQRIGLSEESERYRILYEEN